MLNSLDKQRTWFIVEKGTGLPRLERLLPTGSWVVGLVFLLHANQKLANRETFFNVKS